MKNLKNCFVTVLFVFSLTFSACNDAPQVIPTSVLSSAEMTPSQEPSPETVSQIPPKPTGTPVFKSTPTRIALPPNPQSIIFKAEDGQELEGMYYPAAVMPAPIVVLMHWAGSDQSDWIEVAFWLQNRGLGGNTPNPGHFPWLDPTWFPEFPEEQSYAVFTFTFRGCTKNGCTTFNRGGWVNDSQAAMKTAVGLEGVDTKQIISAGASIGADGAADGCFWLNEQIPGSCLGALSFSPGDYLGIPYAQAIKSLQEDDPSRPAWCVFGEGDTEVAKVCTPITGQEYQFHKYPGRLHGMELIQPGLDPNPLQLFLDFLEKTIGS
jgi:hypothetical protein